MNSVFSIAISGMNKVTEKLNSAASAIVNVSSTKKNFSGREEISTPQDSVTLSPEAEIDLTAEIVKTMEAKTLYEANAKVIAAEKKKQDALLDIFS